MCCYWSTAIDIILTSVDDLHNVVFVLFIFFGSRAQNHRIICYIYNFDFVMIFFLFFPRWFHSNGGGSKWLFSFTDSIWNVTVMPKKRNGFVKAILANLMSNSPCLMACSCSCSRSRSVVHLYACLSSRKLFLVFITKKKGMKRKNEDNTHKKRLKEFNISIVNA